jgi:integrase
MSRVFQRAGRSGWYLGVSVPKSIRKKLGRNEVHKKVGNTHKEALINKSRVEAEIQRYFGVELNQLSLVDEVTAMYESNPNYKGIKSIAEIPAKEKQLLKDIYQVDYDLLGNPTTPEEAALWKALDGQTTWQQWINRRVMTENISKATVRNWESRLKMVSAWKGTDYLTDLTKIDARNFKDYSLRKGHIGSSVKNIIGCLSGFWNWGKDNGIIKENIWEGLKKRLPDPAPRKLPDRSILISATEKAATITPNRKEKDYAFLITRYTGYRNGAANGLRLCVIDLENKTISFVNWEKVVTYNKLRGGKRRENQVRRLKTAKDERTVPMSTNLYEAIKDIPLNKGSDDPIWPRRYKANDDSWGHHHSNEYRKKYGVRAHDLRSFAITKLTHEGVTPFIIYEITRHSIPGISDVVKIYTRPTIEEVRQAMELI